jgi:hypothetical protein
MTAALTLVADNTTTSLVTLAAEIASEHKAAETAKGDALRHAIRCGELLASVKVQLPHGAWIPWLATNFPGTRQTASKYLRLYQRSEHVEGAGSISEAVRSIAKPKTDREVVIDELLMEPPAGPRGESVMRSCWPSGEGHLHQRVVVWGLEAIVNARILALDAPVDVSTYEALKSAVAKAIETVLSPKENVA